MTDNPIIKEAQASGKLLYCSFCGKNQDEVQRLIAGPMVHICSGCVVLCMDIIGKADTPTLIVQTIHEIRSALRPIGAQNLNTQRELNDLLDRIQTTTEDIANVERQMTRIEELLRRTP